jgi:hypothetical protein
MSSARSPACTASKCSAAASTVEVGDLRRRRRLRLVALGVEHPQRVALQRGAALLDSSSRFDSKYVAQRVDVAGPVVGLAEAVEQQVTWRRPRRA